MLSRSDKAFLRKVYKNIGKILDDIYVSFPFSENLKISYKLMYHYDATYAISNDVSLKKVNSRVKLTPIENILFSLSERGVLCYAEDACHNLFPKNEMKKYENMARKFEDELLDFEKRNKVCIEFLHYSEISENADEFIKLVEKELGNS